MKRIMVAGALVLAGCGQQGAVGANSADSVTTTAVGSVVATIPSPTPTPDASAGNTVDTIAIPTTDAGENTVSIGAMNTM